MKTTSLLLTALFFAACSNGTGHTEDSSDSGLLSTDMVRDAATADGNDTAMIGKMPVISFTDTVHDFGNLREGEVVEYAFRFRNTGKSPLLLAGAQSTCGCTASDYPHDPIAPGKDGVITVRFNSAGKDGHEEKTVTLSTNAALPVPQLHISANVKTGAQ